MLTQAQKTELLNMALSSLRFSKGIVANINDFEILIEKPNATSLCSLYLYTKRQDDNLRLRLYVKEFSRFTSVDPFILTQMENYGPGKEDEIYVADCRLDNIVFSSFSKYILSTTFRDQVINATNRLILDNETGYLLTDDDCYITL